MQRTLIIHVFGHKSSRDIYHILKPKTNYRRARKSFHSFHVNSYITQALSEAQKSSRTRWTICSALQTRYSFDPLLPEYANVPRLQRRVTPLSAGYCLRPLFGSSRTRRKMLAVVSRVGVLLRRTRFESRARTDFI